MMKMERLLQTGCHVWLSWFLISGWPALGDNTIQRPIAEFVDAQGTTNVFFPPVGDFVNWFSAFNRPPVRDAYVDYAGLADKYIRTASSGQMSLGTTMTGSIIDRPLGDGRSEVTVILHTKNALTWVNPNGQPNDLLFGYRAPEVLAGAKPALAESHLQLVFRHNASDPMPDLTRDLFLFPDPTLELIAIYFHANATGPLRASAELGPEGTPGRAIVSQTGVLFRSKFRGATADGFPAERVELRRIGH